MKNYFFLFCIIFILFGTYTSIQGSSARTEVINLVALGDSITHGTGDPAKKGYIEGVKVNLEKVMNTPIQVSNFAVPRYTTEKILEQQLDKKINKQLKKADYIILYVGTNDFRKSADYQFSPLNRNKINRGKVSFTTNLYKILENVRKENSAAPIFVLGLYQPYVEYKNHPEVQKIIEEWNVEIVKVTGEFSQTTFVPTLDLFQNKPKEMYFSDSLHPNPAGYQLIADRLYEKVLKESSTK
ncbi:lysophospholipase L1-like esterase [Neobacillus niacini]|uniref:GDSL-type esterase/lipase family protein n=1 Tax=Neobacillus niacini TaxID=86668 RepID=UPI00285B389C|nr:GDSL-type esterase/lipase family protein [Neobacillus niacini]MDR7077022.1 lysophospholipase L1-like esterase [Neobacillus niacini]